MRWAIVVALVLGCVFLIYSGGVAMLSSKGADAPVSAAPADAPAPPPRVALPTIVPSPAPIDVPASPPSSTSPLPAPAVSNPGFAISPADGPSRAEFASHRPGRILRRQIIAGLAEFKSRLASCPDSRVGGLGGDTAERQRAKGLSVLVLELATHDGKMEIVDVTREQQGRSTEAFMSCARAVLRGRMVDAPAATPGSRIYIVYPLASR